MIIDGEFRKRDGKLLASLDGPRKEVEASRDYLLTKVEAQPGWAIAATV